MKLNKVVFSLVVIVLVSGLVLTACAGPAPSPTPTPTPSPTLTPTPTPSPTLTPTPTPQKIVLRTQVFYPPGDAVWDIQALGWKKLIEEATEGRVELELNTPGSLVPDDLPGMFAAVSKGVLDCTVQGTGDVPGTVPEGVVGIGLPFGWQDIYQIKKSCDAGLWDLTREAFGEHNVYMVGAASAGKYALMTSFPMDSWYDIKGKKIRAYGMLQTLISLLGGSPVYIPGGELYMAMKLGTIDGMIYTMPELESAKLKEVVDYIALPTVMHLGISIVLLMNMDKWNSLPDDLKLIIDEACRDAFIPLGEAIYAGDVIGLEKAEEYGCQMITLPEAELEELRELVAPIWEEAAAPNARCARAVELMRLGMQS